MRLKVKRAHMPYPGVRLAHGLKVMIEPDWIAEALIRRGWFDLDTDEQPTEPETTKSEAEEDVPRLRRGRKLPA